MTTVRIKRWALAVTVGILGIFAGCVTNRLTGTCADDATCAQSVDGGFDVNAGPDVPAQDFCATGDAAACGSLNIPDGWSPVGYFEDGRECDPGFDSVPIVMDASVTGSCSCNTASQCTVNPGQCPIGPLTITWDVLNSQGHVLAACGTTYQTITFDNGTCHKFFNGTDVVTTQHFSATIDDAGMSSCSYGGTPANANVTTAQGHLCTSANAACRGALCGAARVCITPANRSGDAGGCPAAFPTRHVVGSAATAQCGSCSCSGACVGSVAVFTGNAGQGCSGNNSAVPLDGSCAQTSNGVQNYSAIQYTATVPNQTCNLNASPPVTGVQLNSPSVICCNF